MKIRITQILVFQLLAVSVLGSELPDSSFIWTVRSISWGQCEAVHTYMVSNDTVIGANIYKKILVTPDSIYSESNSTYFCAARDSAGLWFFIPKGYSAEYLLYDFNASVDDTINLNNPWAVGEVEAYVVSRDSIVVGEKYKTRFGIGYRSGELWEYWIEDIGCLFGPFYSSFFICDIGYELSCIYYEGRFIHNFGFWDICGCWRSTSVEHSFPESQNYIFPNPSNGMLNIINPFNEYVRVSFFSIEGELLREYMLEEYSTKKIAFEYSGVIITRLCGSRKSLQQIIQIIK